METAEKALAELAEISSQIEAAVLFDRAGTVAASTLPEDRARVLATAAAALLEEAGALRDGGELTQLEAATAEGSLFVVRDGEWLIAATTGPEPTGGLVFYDLKSCLRSAAEKPKKPKRRAPAKARSKSSGKT